MSDYQPKVGDKVMVGEHGPYLVSVLCDEGRRTHLRSENGDPVDYCVAPSWLTPAPEPEPELPTERGALIIDGDGRHRFLYVSGLGFLSWIATDGPAVDVRLPADLPRPITVILANPAEVETLREDVKQAEARAIEFQRRINKAVELVDDPGFWSTYSVTRPKMRDILRGES